MTEQISVSGGRVSTPALDAYHTTGPSPTIHLLGPGRVGCAFLGLLGGTGHRVVGVTDSSGTVSRPDGVDRETVIAAKDTGEILDETVVRRGKGLILAAKDAAASHVDRWSDPALGGQVGTNAVLGGTGRRLLDSVEALRGDWVAAAFAGSASTTTIIEVLEDGGSFQDGLAVADERGFLEADPELDLKGVDAAVKLSVVEAALTDRPAALVAAQDLRELDPGVVRLRTEEGLTTRLVGEVLRDGSSTLTYKAVPKGSILDVCCDEVAYTYRLHSGETCTHRGKVLGAGPTAEAVLVDLEARFPATSGGVS